MPLLSLISVWSHWNTVLGQGLLTSLQYHESYQAWSQKKKESLIRHQLFRFFFRGISYSDGSVSSGMVAASNMPGTIEPGLQGLSFRPVWTWGEGAHESDSWDLEFFYFYIIFYSIYQKYISLYFFLQKCHPAAGSFGGKELPPDEPAVRSLAHGPWNLPPFDPAVAPYRQTNRR